MEKRIVMLVVAGLLFMTACTSAAASRQVGPAINQTPTTNPTAEPGWFRPKAQSLTNIRVTARGMELGQETSQPTMWARGFSRIGLILSQPIDLGTPVDQVMVTYEVEKPADTFFLLQVRGSQDQQTWTEWSEVPGNGTIVRIKAPSRYVQYWIHLAANAQTPVVKDVALKPVPSEGGLGPPQGNQPPGTLSLDDLRQKVSFPIFIPTKVPAGIEPQPVITASSSTPTVDLVYLLKDGSVGLRVTIGPAGCCLDADGRKAVGATPIRNGITGYFLSNQPQFGGPILWWQEAGAYVALSGPHLTKDDLVEIAASMSAPPQPSAPASPRESKGADAGPSSAGLPVRNGITGQIVTLPDGTRLSTTSADLPNVGNVFPEIVGVGAGGDPVAIAAGNHVEEFRQEEVTLPIGKAYLAIVVRGQPAAANSNQKSREIWLVAVRKHPSRTDMRLVYAIRGNITGDETKAKAELLELGAHWQLPPE